MRTTMQQYGLIGLAAALGMGAANIRAGDAGRWYMDGDFGMSLMQDLKIKATGTKITFNPGVRFDLHGGYNFTDNIAVELDTGFIWNSVDKVGGLPISPNSADLYAVPILVNGVYKFNPAGTVHPFVGLGIGGVVSSFNIDSVPTGGIKTSDTDFTFGYQAMLGVIWDLGANWNLGATYKFLGTTDHSWKLGGATVKTDMSFIHSFLLTVGYRF